VTRSPPDPPSEDEALGELCAELGVLRGEGATTADEIRTLLSLASDLFTVAGFDGRFQLVSAAWTGALGFPAAELCGAPFIDFVHPDDRAMTETVAARLAQSGRLVAFQNRYRRKQGGYRTLAWRATASQEKQRFYAVARDVSDEVDAREGAAVLSAILEVSGEAIVLQSVGGIITSWNPAAERLCGWAASEVVGKPLGAVLAGAPTVADLRAQAESTAAPERREVVLVHRDGHPVPASIASALFGDSTGHITGAVTLARAL
jgi:PAS domain S-box-containing protein